MFSHLCVVICSLDYAAVTVSRRVPSFAVARNCGIGSSSLNTDVNAFDRLHTVRGWNSSYCGFNAECIVTQSHVA